MRQKQRMTPRSHFYPDACAARVSYSRQRAYLLSVLPFLLVFLLQEVTDDLKEILQKETERETERGEEKKNKPRETPPRSISRQGIGAL